MAPESQHIPQIHSQESFSPQSPPPVSNNGFPILAIAAIGITATAFLLVSYYIFIAKRCFRWRLTDPLSRFLIGRARVTEDPLTSTSPTWQSRGLSELLIRELPTFQYKKQQVGESGTLSKCMICLLEFQDHDVLRLLPKCSHAFHLDCVDVWLQSNSNCPLCRSTISGRKQYHNDRITALNSSPQDPQGQSSIVGGEDSNFVEIALSDEDRSERGDLSRKLEQKIGKGKQGKFRHVSVMGDEGIDVRERDEQFCIQPTIRSFSMDTAADRSVYLSVQEIVRQNRQLREVMDGEERGSRSRKLFFGWTW